MRRSVPSAWILVVDDNSPDKTCKTVQRRMAVDSKTQMVVRPGKRGLASAQLLAMGLLLRGSGEVLVTMDADGSHVPSQIPSLSLPACMRLILPLALGSARDVTVQRLPEEC